VTEEVLASIEDAGMNKRTNRLIRVRFTAMRFIKPSMAKDCVLLYFGLAKWKKRQEKSRCPT
jgi:hypothetical protein